MSEQAMRASEQVDVRMARGSHPGCKLVLLDESRSECREFNSPNCLWRWNELALICVVILFQVDMVDNLGRTPLQLAVASEHLEVGVVLVITFRDAYLTT